MSVCFSNLPIEFDEEGNPYLAEEAEDVDSAPDSACGCAGADDQTLGDTDPEAMYASILRTMPSDVRERVGDSDGRPDPERERPESVRTD